MEGPKAPSEARRSEAQRAEGVGCGASPVRRLVALPPEKFSNLTCKSMHFHAIFAFYDFDAGCDDPTKSN